MTGSGDIPLRYPSRYGAPADAEEPGDGGTSPTTATDRRCSVCQIGRVSARARYCATACEQHAYRLRHPSLAPPALDAVTADLRRRQALVAHTIYECPSCLRSGPSKSVTAKSLRDEGLEQEVLF